MFEHLSMKPAIKEQLLLTGPKVSMQFLRSLIMETIFVNLLSMSQENSTNRDMGVRHFLRGVVSVGSKINQNAGP